MGHCPAYYGVNNMATRATYKILDTVFYCHWDGYRAGAAMRFSNMIRQMTGAHPDPNSYKAFIDTRGDADFAFIRGNNDAEPAWQGCHEGHGDTEFRYDVQKNDAHGFTVRVATRNYGDGWRAWGAPIPLADFINQHAPDLIDDFPGVIETCLSETGNRIIVHLDDAQAILAKELRDLERREDKWPDAANTDYQRKKVNAWRDALCQNVPA